MSFSQPTNNMFLEILCSCKSCSGCLTLFLIQVLVNLFYFIDSWRTVMRKKSNNLDVYLKHLTL